jgi:hypothetical protein
VGRIGNLLFSGNNEPFNLVRVRNRVPLILPWVLEYLGPTTVEAFITYLDEQQTFANPILLASKIAFKPDESLELALGYVVEFGGDGAPSNDPLLYFGEFVSDAPSATNRAFTVDARYRFRSLNLEPYVELLVEDCCDEFPVNSRDILNLVGLYFPAVDPEGKLDFTLEWVRTNQITYRHGVFTSGMTLRNQLLGHRLGPDATGVYGELRYSLSSGNWLKLLPALELRGRRGLTLQDQPITTVAPGYENPETRYRLTGQLHHRLPLGPSTWAMVEAGYEWVTDFNYQAGQERANYLLGFGLNLGL